MIDIIIQGKTYKAAIYKQKIVVFRGKLIEEYPLSQLTKVNNQYYLGGN